MSLLFENCESNETSSQLISKSIHPSPYMTMSTKFTSIFPHVVLKAYGRCFELTIACMSLSKTIATSSLGQYLHVDSVKSSPLFSKPLRIKKLLAIVNVDFEGGTFGLQESMTCGVRINTMNGVGLVYGCMLELKLSLANSTG